MIEALSAGANGVFVLSLVLMVVIALVETVSVVSGFGFSHLVESWFPDLDIVDVGDVAHAGALDAPVDGVSGFTKFMAWIRVGRVPLLMLLVVFLCAFGVIGIGVQIIAKESLGSYLPPLIAVPVVLLVSFPATRVMGRGLARILPHDESSAITEGSFIGRSAVVVTGVARYGSAAQAKMRDEHGQHHYVMVEPDEGEPEFPTGAKVILVKRQGASFLCIADTIPEAREELN